MKILIVDDSEMMRGVIRQALSDNLPDSNPEIDEAGDGAVALEKIRSASFDVVFLDWNMPVLDGLGFVTEVRKAGIHTPIVMISSVTDEEKILEAGRAGVNAYVEKPVRGVKLWEQVKEFLQ